MEDFDDDYDYDYDDPDKELREERNVFERVGFRDDIDELDYFNMDEKKSRTKKTPLERFVESVNGITLDLMSKDILRDGDRKIILQNIQKIDRPAYKNPTGYILGYIVTGGGGDINKIQLSRMVNLIQKELLEDKSVQPPDILRYARLWQNIK
jgi:hypothetical protein